MTKKKIVSKGAKDHIDHLNANNKVLSFPQEYLEYVKEWNKKDAELIKKRQEINIKALSPLKPMTDVERAYADRVINNFNLRTQEIELLTAAGMSVNSSVNKQKKRRKAIKVKWIIVKGKKMRIQPYVYRTTKLKKAPKRANLKKKYKKAYKGAPFTEKRKKTNKKPAITPYKKKKINFAANNTEKLIIEDFVLQHDLVLGIRRRRRLIVNVADSNETLYGIRLNHSIYNHLKFVIFSEKV